MRRGVISLILAGLLSACGGGGGDRAPFSDSRTPPELAERFYPPEGWAWGFVQVGGAPAQRYGVSAAAGVPRADILILTDYGEIAETWFETARDLNRRGYVVWVLDGAGQGGSGRLVVPRDLGYARDFQVDAGAARVMVSSVIRPQAGTTLVVLGQGAGAVAAVLASRRIDREPAGLILSSPALGTPNAPAPAISSVARFLGLDRLRVPGTGPWRTTMKDAFASHATHDRWRGAVTMAWQHANPDLRMGGPSLRWEAAFHDGQVAARRRLSDIQTPTLVIEGDRTLGHLDLPRFSLVRLAGGGAALELEKDKVRDAWLTSVDTFVRARLEDRKARAPLQAPPSPIASVSRARR